jgi:cellulose biosynthesis protein BcsQ
MSSVAIYSSKGGVGKSTFAVNLAYRSAAASGRRTVLWDIDAQGAAGFLLQQERPGAGARRVFSREVEPSQLATPSSYLHLDMIAADNSLRRLDVQLVEEDARKRMRKIIRALERDYDRIILDCPPGLTEISEQVFRAVDVIVVPVPPSALAVRAYDELVAHVRPYAGGGPMILPVLSMVDGRRNLHRDMVLAHPDWHRIPQASAVEQMSSRQAPLATFAPRHAAALAFADLWGDIESHLHSLEARH